MPEPLWQKYRRETGWEGFEEMPDDWAEIRLKLYHYFVTECDRLGITVSEGVRLSKKYAIDPENPTFEQRYLEHFIRRERQEDISASVGPRQEEYDRQFSEEASRVEAEVLAHLNALLEDTVNDDGITIGTVATISALRRGRQFVEDAVYRITSARARHVTVCAMGTELPYDRLVFDYAPLIFKNLGIAAKDEGGKERYFKPGHSELPPEQLARLCFRGTPVLEALEAPVPFTVPDKLRPEHSLVLGKSGSGKSTTLFHMIHEDIRRGKASIIFIEPKGSWTRAVSYLSDFVGNDRLRIIDPKYAPAFNFFALPKRLQNYPPKQRREIIANITEQYSRAFKAFNVKIDESANQETALSYVSEVVFSKGGSLSDMQRILEDPAPKYEKSSIMPEIEQYMDDDMRGYFENQYYGGFVVGSRKSLAGKLRKLLRGGFNFREMFDANVNKVDLYERMQTPGSVTLINTEQGRLKPEASSFLGRLMLSQIFDAAIQRQSFGENTHPVYVYVDEAHLYVDETIEQFMLQTREAKVSLVLATQKLESLKEARSAVLSETAIKIVAPSPADIKAASDNTNQTSEELFRSLTREGEFAVYYRPMESAVKVLIPNTVKKADYMTADEHKALIDRNYHHFKDEPRKETKTEKRTTISLPQKGKPPDDNIGD